MAMPPRTRFTLEDADTATEEWGANCGPGAVAAIMNMTLEEVRPIFAAAGFEAKHYTNPTMMWAVLASLPCIWRKAEKDWPRHGLVRIQWEGPWTEQGVPIRARYRHTHWVCGAQGSSSHGVFDINAINNGSGWVSREDWASQLVPWIVSEIPRANGKWHITHSIEIGADEKDAG